MESDIRERLQGIFVPVATPFKADEDLDTDALTHNLAIYGNTALRGCVVLGSNGECKSLDEAEKETILETVFANVTERLTITVGVMYEAQRHAERFIRRVADSGADFALVQSPSYFRKQLTDDAIYSYFSSLADRRSDPPADLSLPGIQRHHALFRSAGETVRAPQHRGNEGQHARLRSQDHAASTGTASTSWPAPSRN